MLVCLIWGRYWTWMIGWLFISSLPWASLCHLPRKLEDSGCQSPPFIPSRPLLQMPIKDETLKAVSLSRLNQEYWKVPEILKLLFQMGQLAHKSRFFHVRNQGGLLHVDNNIHLVPAEWIKKFWTLITHLQLVWNRVPHLEVTSVSASAWDQLVTVSLFSITLGCELCLLIRMDGKQVWQFWTVIGT